MLFYWDTKWWGFNYSTKDSFGGEFFDCWTIKLSGRGRLPLMNLVSRTFLQYNNASHGIFDRQGSAVQNSLPSFAMEQPQGASGNASKHRKTNSPVQRWRPVSTQASPRKGLLHFATWRFSSHRDPKVAMYQRLVVAHFNLSIKFFFSS
jgi:hypothetical protein